MKDHAIHQELVDSVRDRRGRSASSLIVENGIAVGELDGVIAGAKYLRDREIPMHIAHRVLVCGQRRAGDWQ